MDLRSFVAERIVTSASASDKSAMSNGLDCMGSVDCVPKRLLCMQPVHNSSADAEIIMKQVRDNHSTSKRARRLYSTEPNASLPFARISNSRTPSLTIVDAVTAAVGDDEVDANVGIYSRQECLER